MSFVYSELLYKTGQDFFDIQYLKLYVLEPLLYLLSLKLILDARLTHIFKSVKISKKYDLHGVIYAKRITYLVILSRRGCSVQYLKEN